MILRDKVAIVTGSAQGIGRAIATMYVQNGAKVVMCDINGDKVKSVAKEIQLSMDMPVIGMQCDVTKRDQIKKVVEATVTEFGRIDILVSNAAVLILSPFLEYSDENWDKTMDINLKGSFMFSQEVAKVMVKQQYGRIIITSSAAAKKAVDNHLAYCTAKAGITGLVRMIALEMGQYGITCNAICPGITDTEMVRSTYLTNPEIEAEWAQKNVFKRLGRMEDQAKAALMLASEYADYITGESIMVSGGEVMGQ